MLCSALLCCVCYGREDVSSDVTHVPFCSVLLRSEYSIPCCVTSPPHLTSSIPCPPPHPHRVLEAKKKFDEFKVVDKLVEIKHDIQEDVDEALEKGTA